MRLIHIYKLLLIGIISALIVTSCAVIDNQPIDDQEVVNPIDPLFSIFYEKLGGYPVMGPAISPVIKRFNNRYQYTVAGLMAYNALDPISKFKLVSLGNEFGVYEVPDSFTEGQDIEQQPIYDKFLPLYHRLGGEDIVGKPITRVHLNNEKNRYEQYFENIGFYWEVDAPPTEVKLLAYGAWMCGQACRKTQQLNNMPSFSHKKIPIFNVLLASYGIDFAGFALSEPYLTNEGTVEQIYENVVMIWDPDYPGEVSLKPYIEMLEPLSEYGFIFLDEDSQDYDVPTFFTEYIESNGGSRFIGSPITELIEDEDNNYRQCFSSICIDGVIGDSGDIEVMPIPLGLKYRENYYLPEELRQIEDLNLNVSVNIGKNIPMIHSNQSQQFSVFVYLEGKPFPHLSPRLSIEFPDGSEKNYSMPPTDNGGQSFLEIEPIEARNLTMIGYKICVEPLNITRKCGSDSFVIFRNNKLDVDLPKSDNLNPNYLPMIFQEINVELKSTIDNASSSIYMPLVINRDD